LEDKSGGVVAIAWFQVVLAAFYPFEKKNKAPHKVQTAKIRVFILTEILIKN
jgi:hypothetical protein